ncbi:hypothetical protein D3C81_1985600 [compost metagenome]
MVIDPLADAAVFRVVVVNQQGVDARFADQQFLLELAMAVTQPGGAQLIFVQVACHACDEIRVIDQAGQVAHREPGFVVQQQDAQWALVADEGEGPEDFDIGFECGAFGHFHYLC